MEDVWKDIILPSLSHESHDHSHPCSHSCTPTTRPAAAFRGIIFQDFLATTTTTPPPTTKVGASNISSASLTVVAPASTVLSLNSGTRTDLQHLLNESTTSTSPLVKPMAVNPQTLQITATNFINYSSSCSEIALESSAVFSRPSYSNKRAPPPLHQDHDDRHSSSSDRRHKRMMKNRESATRSRARKQAYTNELEIELAQLREENARLKSQQAKFCLEGPVQLSKRHTLHRTSTAPF